MGNAKINDEVSFKVSFKVSNKDSELISLIAKRAVKQAAEQEIKIEPLDMTMDLTAVHANGCPLRLADLLTADEFNFAHDIHGIRFNLNRRTGRLGNCFVPRFAAPQEATPE